MDPTEQQAPGDLPEPKVQVPVLEQAEEGEEGGAMMDERIKKLIDIAKRVTYVDIENVVYLVLYAVVAIAVILVLIPILLRMFR